VSEKLSACCVCVALGQEVRLLVGCALGSVLRIRAPEVPYEEDETLKARPAPRNRAPARPVAALFVRP
jgi:hypothetical protein